MRFAELKERSLAIHEEEQRLLELGRREWMCPDGYTVINVSIRPWNDSHGIQLSVHTLQPCGGGYTVVAGKRIEDKNIEFVHDPLIRCTAQQLDYLTKARLMCERYVEGHIAELPDTLF